MTTPNDPDVPATRVVHRTTVVKKSGRTRWLIAAGVLAAAIAALLYARCAGGLGFGRGEGEAEKRPAVQPVAESVPAAPTPPCELRLDAAGLTVDGTAMEIAGAIEACKPAGKARLLVTGDSKYGAMVSIREALEAAGITVLGP